MDEAIKPDFWRRAVSKTASAVYFRRRVRTINGVFEVFVSPNSGLKVLRLPAILIEPVHQRFIRDWIDQNAVVWDVGANLGLFAFPAALKAIHGQVYGFEADVDLAANLVRSIRLPKNRKLNFAIFCAAVSNAEGTATFQISRYSRAMNKLKDEGTWRDLVSDETRSVVTIRIDTLARTLAPPSAIKIDVEGAEMSVLEGAHETIAKYRPAMLVEGPKELWDRLAGFFQKHNYVLFDGASEEKRPIEKPVWDTVAIPREKFPAGC